MGISTQDYQDVKITVTSAGESVLEGIADQAQVQWETGTVAKRPMDAPDELTIFTGPTIGELALSGLEIPSDETPSVAELEDPNIVLSIEIKSADSVTPLLSLSECVYRNGYEEGNREDGSQELGRVMWQRTVKFTIIEE